MVKRLRYLFLGSPDRIITTMSLAVGIVSLILSALAYKIPTPPPEYIIVRDNIVILNFYPYNNSVLH